MWRHCLKPWSVMVDTDHNEQWNARGHFFGAAAEAMRRILVERARRKNAVKHGGQFEASSGQLLSVHEALENLAKSQPQAAELVKIAIFRGARSAGGSVGDGNRTESRRPLVGCRACSAVSRAARQLK